METLKRALLFVAGLSFIFLIASFILSFFLIFWPVLVIGTLAAAAYAYITSKFGPPPSSGVGKNYTFKETHKTIIIEHQEDEVNDDEQEK